MFHVTGIIWKAFVCKSEKRFIYSSQTNTKQGDTNRVYALQSVVFKDNCRHTVKVEHMLLILKKKRVNPGYISLLLIITLKDDAWNIGGS